MTKVRPAILKAAPVNAYSRWQLPPVGDDALQRSVAETGNTKPITAAELESLQQKAYEEGFAAGHGDGFAQGKREGLEAAAVQSQSQVERLQAILRGLAAPLEALDEEVEGSLVALVVAIARQVVRGELAIRPEQILMVVREAIGTLPTAARKVRLYLHPDDLSLVREGLCDELENAQWTLRDDTTLERGGCRVESDTSRIDASVELRLARVIAQVLDVEGTGAALIDEG